MIGDISHIVVIESLENERKTGTELYNDCIKRKIEFKNSGITHNLYNIKTKEGFTEILKYYITNCTYLTGGILIHIEMHGDKSLKGLVVSDGTLITWSEMVDLFRPINVTTCNNLYICMATCNGRYLYRGVQPHEKSPYSCFISASKPVGSSEILEQFSLLFESLIQKGNLVQAYLEMEKQSTLFYYKDSKEIFEEAFASTAKRFRTDPKTREDIIRQTKEQVSKEGLEMPSEDAFNERAGWMVFLNVDPIWDPIRNDARFIAILRKMD